MFKITLHAKLTPGEPIEWLGGTSKAFTRAGSGLKRCWLKVNFCVICLALNNTPLFCQWLDGKKLKWITDVHAILSLSPLFLTLSFSQITVTGVYQRSHTVIQLQKAVSKACISSLLGEKPKPPHTALSPASYVLTPHSKKCKTNDQPITGPVYLKSILELTSIPCTTRTLYQLQKLLCGIWHSVSLLSCGNLNSYKLFFAF